MMVTEGFNLQRSVLIFHRADRNLRMKKMRSKSCCVGICLDPLQRSLIQFTAVRRQLINRCICMQRGVANFYQALVSLVVNGKHIDHLIFKCILKSRIHKISPPLSSTGTQYFRLNASQKSCMESHPSWFHFLLHHRHHLFQRGQKW